MLWQLEPRDGDYITKWLLVGNQSQDLGLVGSRNHIWYASQFFGEKLEKQFSTKKEAMDWLLTTYIDYVCFPILDRV